MVNSMATQALYRRYRPRRFSELRGQDHVVRALRNAVINHREGQAYLFSGPRGTGKTSTARILAKVLNCENPIGGEPCCECPSCISVERGTSYDVLELDAASNNGVQEIRDLIESASLASPGRHRVFILDEVHMLSRGAEAALLKTLEEPPEHVVFVLATTDPQKVSETIRSRVQHLQFHLLPMEELSEYVHWVAKDAGLEVDETSIERVLQQGGGSARDTLSALELVASGGGDLDAPASVDELIESLIQHDQGRALASVAFAVQQGRDPRTFTEDIIRALRDAFLSLMAPELVQLPDQRAEVVATQAKSLGAAAVVRAMETLGSALIDMRHAPDPRLLLEVSVVKMASPESDTGIDGLMARIAHLEEVVKRMQMRSAEPSLPPAPLDPTTGRARPGGRAAVGSATGPIARPAPPPSRADTTAPTARPPQPVAAVSDAPTSSQHQLDPAAAWPQIVNSLQKLAKAIFGQGSVKSVIDGVVTIEVANKATVDNASKYIGAVEAAIVSVCGSPYKVKIVATAAAPTTEAKSRPAKKSVVEEVRNDPTAPVDPNEILDIAPDTDPTVERLRSAFPGAKIVTDKK